MAAHESYRSPDGSSSYPSKRLLLRQIKLRGRICWSRIAENTIYIRIHVMLGRISLEGREARGQKSGSKQQRERDSGRGPYLSSDRCLLRLACKAGKENAVGTSKLHSRRRIPDGCRICHVQARTAAFLDHLRDAPRPLCHQPHPCCLLTSGSHSCWPAAAASFHRVVIPAGSQSSSSPTRHPWSASLRTETSWHGSLAKCGFLFC